MTTPSPGIYPNIPFHEYAAWEAWNPSTIKLLLLDSPRAMRHTIDSGGRPASDTMDLGRAAHCAVFEPVRAAETYAIMPDYQLDGDNRTQDGKPSQSRATSYYKARVAEFEAANVDREIIEYSDYLKCIAMRDAVHNHPAAGAILAEQGTPEVSVVWQDKGAGLLCKGRMDWLVKRAGILADLKTAADPKPHRFHQQAAQLMYHVSLGAYVAGLEANGVTVRKASLIAVGNQPWHDVIVYECAESMIRIGRRLWTEGLQRTAWCLKHNNWPGFSDEPWPIELPTWAIPEDEAVAVS